VQSSTRGSAELEAGQARAGKFARDQGRTRGQARARNQARAVHHSRLLRLRRPRLRVLQKVLILS